VFVDMQQYRQRYLLLEKARPPPCKIRHTYTVGVLTGRGAGRGAPSLSDTLNHPWIATVTQG
jgi:hypothetical protein